jgi:hypothetical protein
MRQFLSIQERKISTLIVGFLFFCGLGAYLAITGEVRDLPDNLVSVIIALITAIAGVNAVDSLTRNGKEIDEGRDDRGADPTI